MTELKACVDCRHFNRATPLSGPKCKRYKKFDFVHGPVQRSARLARATMDECGPTGKGWEPKARISPWPEIVLWLMMLAGVVAWCVRGFWS